MAERDDRRTWTTGEIASRLRLDREGARNVTTLDSFPDPVLRLPHQWLVTDVEEWIAEHRPNNAA